MRGNITHQGTVTTSVSYSQEEFKRRRNAGKGGAGTVYPGGADTNNLRVARNDLIMGWKKATLGTHMPGRPQECGWSSFNGIDLQDYNGDPEELADDIYFIGVSRTDYNPTDPLAPQNGLAVIRKGTVDPFYTGKADVFPGDDMIWSAPRLDDSFQTTGISQWEGKPREKLPPVIEPLSFDDIQLREHLLVDIAQKTGGDGVAKRDFSDIIEARDLSKNQKTALLLREHAMASALYVVDALVRAGIIKIMTPQARAAEKVALNGKTLAESKTLLLGDDAKKTSVAEGKNLTFEGVDLNSHLSVMQKLAFPEDALVGADKTALQKELVAQRDQSLLWLSTLLGLTKSSTLKPATLVQNLVLRGLYPASFLVLESRPALNIPNLSSFKFSTLANERRLANAYSSKAQSFQTRYRIVLSELQHSVTRRYIGKALSHVVGGQSNMRVDLLLTTRK